MRRTEQQQRSSQAAKESPAYKRALRQLGTQVRALRTERKWTLEHAAELSEMDLKHWQKIEAGQLNVTMVTLVRMAEGLGVELGELFAASDVSKSAKKR